MASAAEGGDKFSKFITASGGWETREIKTEMRIRIRIKIRISSRRRSIRRIFRKTETPTWTRNQDQTQDQYLERIPMDIPLVPFPNNLLFQRLVQQCIVRRNGPTRSSDNMGGFMLRKTGGGIEHSAYDAISFHHNRHLLSKNYQNLGGGYSS